jgi:hypothetical protein
MSQLQAEYQDLLGCLLPPLRATFDPPAVRGLRAGQQLAGLYPLLHQGLEFSMDCLLSGLRCPIGQQGVSLAGRQPRLGEKRHKHLKSIEEPSKIHRRTIEVTS